MVIDKHSIRKQNRSVIIEQIISNQPISRVELSKLTNINKATVSEIIKELLDNELIEEVGVGNSTSAGGRKPTMLQMNYKAGLCVAIDLGATYIAVSLFYINGIRIYLNIHRELEINSQNAVSHIENVIHEVESIKADSIYGITGITIAVHGITLNNKIIFSSQYDLDKIDFKKEISERFKYPIYIENEANLTALAENTFSSTHKNLVCLSIHTGIGVGIINNGDLYTGMNGMAGEIGHTILFPDGKPCRCGNHGCLELYCSESSILEQYEEITGITNATPDILQKAYYEGEKAAATLSTQMSKYLAIAINNTVVSYSPDVVYINSPIIFRIPEMINQIQDFMQSFFSRNIIIKNSSFGSKAILHGACANVIKNFLQVKHLKFCSKNEEKTEDI